MKKKTIHCCISNAIWHVYSLQAMEELVDSGKVRSIGVSNFNSEQIDRIVQAARYQPVTNQVCNG